MVIFSKNRSFSLTERPAQYPDPETIRKITFPYSHILERKREKLFERV